MSFQFRRSFQYLEYLRLVFLAAMAFASVGCRDVESTKSVGNMLSVSNDIQETRFDLGIIARGKEFKYNIPFLRLGISADDSIASSKTSCKCVMTKEVGYLSTDSKKIQKVLSVIVESDSKQLHLPPTALAVEISLETKAGLFRSFTALFTEATFVSLANDVDRFEASLDSQARSR